jgi:hypothetical protein
VETAGNISKQVGFPIGRSGTRAAPMMKRPAMMGAVAKTHTAAEAFFRSRLHASPNVARRLPEGPPAWTAAAFLI